MKFPGMDLNFDRTPRPLETDAGRILIDGREVPLLFQRNAQARRYRLYLDRAGRPRVTIPRGGTQREAMAFVARHTRWLAERLRRFTTLPRRDTAWRIGTEVYLRGQPVSLAQQAGAVSLGDQILIPFPRELDPAADLRPLVENHLRTLAEAELPSRTVELAARHAVRIARVTVRAQTSRWGSSSRAGTISLNWRLIQTPHEVRDYVILHELMHQREMNHSPRFWAHVAAACPTHESCRHWLKQHGAGIL